MVSEKRIAALADLASFLVWIGEDKPGQMWGAVKVERALQCLSEITGLTMDQLLLVAHAGERKAREGGYS